MSHNGAHGDGNYEKSDVQVGLIKQHLTGFFIFATVSILLTYAGYVFFMHPKVPAEQEIVLPPAPNPILQDGTTAKLDIRQLRQHDEKALASYGVLDPAAGVYRIPIKSAIDLVVERGVPRWTAKPSAPTGGQIQRP